MAYESGAIVLLFRVTLCLFPGVLLMTVAHASIFKPPTLEAKHSPRPSVSSPLPLFQPFGTVRARTPKAERINLLKQAVEKYGNGKKDEDLTPCVVLGNEHCPAAAGVTGADASSGDTR